MKHRRDYTIASIVFGITVLLISIFFEEYLFGLDTPLIVVGLVFLAYAHFRQRKIKRDRLGNGGEPEEEN